MLPNLKPWPITSPTPSGWTASERGKSPNPSLKDVTEELGHATKLAHRLKQLGDCPPGSLTLARNQKALQPPKDSTDVRSVVEGVLAAEKDAIAHYQQLIAACEGKDHVTQDLAIGILADEEEHGTLFESFSRV